jgi:hypothetical protein
MTVSVISVAMTTFITVFVVPLLRVITIRGHTPRLAVMVWLSVSFTVFASWMLAGIATFGVLCDESDSAGLFIAAVTLTGAHWPAHVLYCLVGVALITPSARFVYCFCRIHREARRERERRRGALRVLGEQPPELRDVTVIPSDLPMVYCMPGKPGVIVVTTAARDALGGEQFAAVLAHERSHLTEHHHLKVSLARAIGEAGKGIWLFHSTEQLVRDLVEMRADDVAMRRFGPRAVATAIGKLSVAAPPSPALGAADGAVVTRILRMSDPPSRRARVLSGFWSCSLTALCCFHLTVMVAIPVFAMMVNGLYVYEYVIPFFS